MWSSNVCKTLNRPTIGFGKWSVFLPTFRIQTISSVFSLRQLVASTFYKTRLILKYFGKNTTELSPKLNSYSLVIKSTSDTSALSRFIADKQSSIRRFNAYFEGSHFRVIKRRHLTGTALSFGFVGVCLKNENGYPQLLPYQQSKPFSLANVFHILKEQAFELKELREDINNVNKILFKDCISKGCSGVVYKAEIKSKKNDNTESVAVKMLFNYDIESNSMAIINSTVKECLPYCGKFGQLNVTRKKLSPHPNIVKILSVFVDYFQPLADCTRLYPHALPYHYGGYGRNMTLFMVEKLYDMTLKEYLHLFSPSSKCSLAILTQCFEAIDFLQLNDIAHRDLKPDNVLVSLSHDSFPWIVISDFGHCTTSLVLPFQTEEVSRGGNRALMAPEIVTAKASRDSVLNYHKADLWSMGTIAYEIFGKDNPFYKRSATSTKLDSAIYHEHELPPFPANSPILCSMIRAILNRDPKQRPTTAMTAGLSHLLFHMGSKKVKKLIETSNKEVRNKLIDEWFKYFVGGTFYRIVNGIELTESFVCKMKVIFLTKMQSKDVQMLFDSLNELLVIE